MLTFLTSNAIALLSGLVAIILAYAYIKFKINQHDKDLQRVETKFDKELEEMKTKHEHDKDKIYEEIDDVKKTYMCTNSKILDKLDQLVKDVKDISVDLAYFKGKKSKK